MARNPVFPLYYNDMLGSTKTWTDEEFGAYMRLLIEQWDNGYIPSPYQNSTKNLPLDFQRLSRISTSVEKNWQLLSKKFVDNERGLQNTRLEEIRLSKQKHSEKQRKNIEKRYQTSTTPSTNDATKNLPLEDESEIEYILSKIRELNKEVNIYSDKNENLFLMLVVKMLDIFKSEFPDYFFHKESDYTACLKIAYNIAQMNKWTKESVVNGRLDDCLGNWKNIVVFIKSDKWFSSRSLSDIAEVKEWQRLVQKLKIKKDGATNSGQFVTGKDNPNDKL